MRLNTILEKAIKKGASDVHLKANKIPMVRKHGKLRPLDEKMPPVYPEDIEQMAALIMNDEQQKRFDKDK